MQRRRSGDARATMIMSHLRRTSGDRLELELRLTEPWGAPGCRPVRRSNPGHARRDQRSIAARQARQARHARHAAVQPQLTALVRRIRDRNEWDDVFVDTLCTPPVSFPLGACDRGAHLDTPSRYARPPRHLARSGPRYK
jgi:hypothetical protein